MGRVHKNVLDLKLKGFSTASIAALLRKSRASIKLIEKRIDARVVVNSSTTVTDHVVKVPTKNEADISDPIM